MTYKLRTFACAGCGVRVTKRARADAEIRCIMCSIAQAADAARQLHAHTGAFYARWLASKGPAGRPRKETTGPAELHRAGPVAYLPRE